MCEVYVGQRLICFRVRLVVTQAVILQQKRGNMSIAGSNLQKIKQTSRTKTKEKVSWWKRMKRESGKDDFESLETETRGTSRIGLGSVSPGGSPSKINVAALEGDPRPTQVASPLSCPLRLARFLN